MKAFISWKRSTGCASHLSDPQVHAHPIPRMIRYCPKKISSHPKSTDLTYLNFPYSHLPVSQNVDVFSGPADQCGSRPPWCCLHSPGHHRSPRPRPPRFSRRHTVPLLELPKLSLFSKIVQLKEISYLRYRLIVETSLKTYFGIIWNISFCLLLLFALCMMSPGMSSTAVTRKVRQSNLAFCPTRFQRLGW